MTESTVPERVRRADGSWAAVDLTLRANGDGTISPVASPTAVVLSGGGTGPLAKTVSQGQELVWTWTGVSLPAPTLAGPVATYASVLPDVDLKVRVDEWGFSEVLVVKNAEAAANPALTALRFALSGSGMSEASAAGTATTPAEAVSSAFEIGSAYMWDSTPPAEKPPAAMPAEDVQSETISSPAGPGSGAKVLPMPMAMDGSTLVVTPAQSLLTDPSATFPIYVDPTSSSPARSAWTMINKAHPDQEYWDFDRSSHAKVGNAGDGTNMYRSLFQFSTSAWLGKHVTAVEFADDLVHSWSCTATTTELHLSSKTLSSSTTWNSNASSWGASLAAASKQNCDDAAGVTMEWPSTSALVVAVDKLTTPTITVGLRAASETISNDGSNGWQKFDETSGKGGAHLKVTYNTAPKLTSLHTDAGDCASSASTAPVLTSLGHNPVPQVTVADGENDQSKLTFTYPKAGGGTSTKEFPNVASKSSQQLVGGIPAAALADGGTYSWTVTASDGTDSTSQQCYFKIDNTVPEPPSIETADDLYPRDTGTGAVSGAAGKTGWFTIAATGDSAPDVVKYVWGPMSGGTLRTVATTGGAPVSVPFTPGVGDNTLRAYAYTAAGVQSGMGSYDFQAGSADDPVGRWLLDGDGSDAETGGHTATASDVTWLDDGRQIGQRVAHFNGTSSLLSADAPGRTDTSFAVSAWVRPTGTSCAGTAVAQDGIHASGFYLGCYQGKFSFDVVPQDAAVASTRVVSTATAPIGLWSDIVGVYDPGAGTIQLYVNGVSQGTASLSVRLWNAAGPFVIGRARYNDAGTDWWTGDISDVHVWDRVAYQADIDALSASSWLDQYPLGFDPTLDVKGANNALTWTGSPTVGYDNMNPPGSGGTRATVLSSAHPDYATALGPSVRTDGSFTVSAWINPATLTGVYMDAVSQNSTITSNFGLGVSAANHYDFWMHYSDTLTSAPALIQSTAVAEAGQWVNLIGTFDFTARTLTLYVNGTSQGSVTFPATPWQTTGPLMIGAGQWKGAVDYKWNGGIDNVALFNGVLDATEISNLYNFNDPHPADIP